MRCAAFATAGLSAADRSRVEPELHQADRRRSRGHAQRSQRPPGGQRGGEDRRALRAALWQQWRLQFAQTDHHSTRLLLHDGRQPWGKRRQPFLGTRPRKWIIGKAFATYWPIDRVGIL